MKSDFFARFKRGQLRSFWLILNPLSQVFIYTFVLSNVLSNKIEMLGDTYSYSVFLLSGFIGWSLFYEIIMRATNIFIDKASLMTKISFPKPALILSVLGVALINNIILIGIIFVIFWVLGFNTSIQLLWIFPLSLCLGVFAANLGFLFGFLNVFIRDLTQIVPIFLQFLFWFTPIVYPLNIIPVSHQYLLSYNPLLKLIKAYQEVVLLSRPPSFSDLVPLLVFGSVVFLINLFLFKKGRVEFTDQF